MKTETINVTKDIEYLGDLEPFKSDGIPSHCILWKKLPGFGATFWEIYYGNRNSIIFEPHVPVIEGKQRKNSKVLGVHGKVTQADIRAYLDNDIYPKKIITTPESYIKKVRPVIEKHKTFNLFKDFFALFDECDKLVTDINYRGKIIAPMDDFFKFEKKALVSATPIMPSDIRFEEQRFKIIEIVPDYDYRKDLRLVSTNNIVAALRHTLDGCSKDPIFIFLNSTLTIFSIIKLLGIETESKVFCADESIITLKHLLYESTSTELGDFAKYNFITSRFFSAVDVDLQYKPDVIMITDVFQASHSILDPLTECIQISGRFRKAKGAADNNAFRSLTHITNYKPHIKFRSPIEATRYISSSYRAYKDMLKRKENETEEGAVATYTQGLANTEISDFLKPDGSLESFMIDNYIHQQRVRSYYRSEKHLLQGYVDSQYFNVFPTSLTHPVSDAENIGLAMAKTGRQITETVAILMNKFTTISVDIKYKFYDPQTEINKLRKRYPDIVNAFDVVGFDCMKENQFKIHLIKKIVEKTKRTNYKMSKDMFRAVHKEFKGTSQVLETKAIPRLQSVYDEMKLKIKANAKDLLIYYTGSRRGNAENKKVYHLIKEINPHI